MNKSVSKHVGKNRIFKLEALRGFAAFYVFFAHFLSERVIAKSAPVGLLLRFGQEAVMLFFLLSGVVIYYSAGPMHSLTFRGYFIRRFRRVYPLFVLAMLTSYIASCLSTGILRDFDWVASAETC